MPLPHQHSLAHCPGTNVSTAYGYGKDVRMNGGGGARWHDWNGFWTVLSKCCSVCCVLHMEAVGGRNRSVVSSLSVWRGMLCYKGFDGFNYPLVS